MSKEVSAKDFLIHLAKFYFAVPGYKKAYNYARSHKVLNDFVFGAYISEEKTLSFVYCATDKELEDLIMLIEEWWKENGKELEEWIKMNCN